MALCLVWSLIALLPAVAWGQSVGRKGKASRIANNLIRTEYYAAMDLLEDGQMLQAYQGFEQALGLSRQVGEERGIDSVPPMVMMGECLYAQGDIGGALENYDAALAISIRCSNWISLLQSAPPAERIQGSQARDIQWGTGTQRNAQYSGFPEGWSIALGAPEMLLETATGKGVAGKLVPIDALEILRCQAIALRRRSQLLGALAMHNPLSPALPRVFEIPNGINVSDPIRSAVSVCRSLAMISTPSRKEVANLLKQNLSLVNGHDHPLTAVALLSLADLSIDANEYLTGEEYCMEASLTAAKAEQMEHVEEAIELWSKCVNQNRREAANLSKILQQISKWSASRSRLVSIRCQVETVRQAALRGDVETVRKQASVATSMLLPNAITLPRMDAIVAHAQSRIAFIEGNIAQGVQKLDESLALLRGNSPWNGASRHVFQLNLVLRLVDENQIPIPVATAILQNILLEDSHLWKIHPVEQLLFQTSDKANAWGTLHRLAMESNDIPTELASWDALAGYRFRQNSLLQGRLMEARRAFHTTEMVLSPKQKVELDQLKRSFPAATQNAENLQAWISPFKAEIKWDSRKWTEEENKRWDAIVRLSSTQEALLWAAAISPVVIPNTFPPRWDPDQWDKTLRADDAVVVFGVRGGTLHGYLYADKKWEKWVVQESTGWAGKLDEARARVQGGEAGNSKPLLASLSSAKAALFPDRIWKKLSASGRWIVVPDGILWQFPWECLPLQTSGNLVPSLSKHPIAYSPTLGCVPMLFPEISVPPKHGTVVVNTPEFWGADKVVAKSARDRLGSHFAKAGWVETNNLAQSVPSRYIKLHATRVMSFLPTNWGDPNAFVVAADRNPNQSNLAAWNQLPWGVPSQLWFFGANMEPSANLAGDEWLRWSLALVSQGAKQMTVSRWRVGGESTISLAQAYDENVEFDPASNAWQRAVASLWIEEYEEILPNGGKQMVSGEVPRLWGGYMCIGDTAP